MLPDLILDETPAVPAPLHDEKYCATCGDFRPTVEREYHERDGMLVYPQIEDVCITCRRSARTAADFYTFAELPPLYIGCAECGTSNEVPADEPYPTCSCCGAIL